MEDLQNGRYALYSGKEVLGEFTLKDGVISYDNEADEHSIGDIFPADAVKDLPR